ncbi:microprocessor complex subunit DGCR8-like [Melanaphis sacchari]|uniref:microprocessor complex subunit DGCR8-like n=1 Tax=Melanaphis sacchari TaxID=742174 RepID=UPI000DC130D6|nr:microprocessor complex subunit DGCR8-like [Melanaphis sacchari]
MSEVVKSNLEFDGSEPDTNDGVDEYDMQLQSKINKFNETIIRQEYQKEKNETTTDLGATSCSYDLPKGWEKIDHDSDMPIYMNTETRVCSFSKPYYLGASSLKNHEIPVENVPCLNQKLNNETYAASTSTTSNKCPLTLSHDEYRNYCSKVFKFKNIKSYKFNSWAKRRQYIRKQKADLKIKNLQTSTSIPTTSDYIVKNNTNAFNPENLQTLISLKGKSYISILHEYIQRVLKTSSHSFMIKELENSKYPYLSIAIIDEIQYGIGTGSTKKQAKTNSAKATLEILLPSVKQFHIDSSSQARNGIEDISYLDHYKIFDQLKVTDSKIPQICAQSIESTPYEMLKLCIKRNFGNSSNLLYEVDQMQNESDGDNYYRCTMIIRKYSATVICKDKLGGRQKGAQALLKVLHPHIHYYGSLLRLYSRQHFEYKENKPIEPTVKIKKCRSCPDVNLLKTLRTAMLKLESQKNN